KILEIDSDRRRLSLSVKRVEDQILPRLAAGPQAVPEGPGDLDDLPELGLSEDVFAGAPAPTPFPETEEPAAEAEAEAEAAADTPPSAADEAAAPPADEPVSPPAEEPSAEAAADEKA
ncbi:MAG: 30S ribosomal protein S1, partial [Solirubrobacteraceae bacterium]